MKMYEEWIELRFLNLGTGCRWVVASRSGRFTTWEKAPDINWIGGLMGPRAGLDDMEKWKFFTLLRLELQTFGCPARSQSLYQLR
jgi:hypothetical protein